MIPPSLISSESCQADPICSGRVQPMHVRSAGNQESTNRARGRYDYSGAPVNALRLVCSRRLVSRHIPLRTTSTPALLNMGRWPYPAIDTSANRSPVVSPRPPAAPGASSSNGQRVGDLLWAYRNLEHGLFGIAHISALTLVTSSGRRFSRRAAIAY